MAGVTTETAAPAAAPEQTSTPSVQPKQNDDKNNSQNKNKDQQDVKKTKPRRERLPLPDPIPEAPVKRYPEPKKADLQARVNEEDAKLQACFDRLNSTRAFYDERQKIREQGRPAIDAALKTLTGLNDQCRVLFEERKVITTKLKQIRDADMNARVNASSSSNELAGAGKDGNEALKNIRTIEELEAKIAELKHTQAHSSLPLPEEKKLVMKISFLTNKGRKFIQDRDSSIKKEKAEREARIVSRKELEETRKGLDTRIDAIKAKIETQKKVTDGIRREQDEKIKALQSTTSEINRDEEKKKIGEIKAIIKKMRDDFQDELDKWYLNERIHYEQVKIARKKKQEAVQAERDARRKKWEEEQAQYPEPHPYQAEKDMCSGLIVYMQTLLGETSEKPSVQLGSQKTGPSLKNTSQHREIAAEGKAIGKSSTANIDGFENLSFSDYVKKSSKGKKGKGRRSHVKDTSTNDETALKPHSMDYLTAFTKLDIKPPSKMSEVRTALEAVIAKKDYYETLEPPSEEEKAKKTENKPKKQDQGEKAVNGVNITNGDGDAAFPGLISDSTTPVHSSKKTSMPSFMAVASGAATAPVPAPVPGPALTNENETAAEHTNGEPEIVESAIGADTTGADITSDSAMPPTASLAEA